MGGGARLMGLDSTKELFCGFSDNSSSDSEPVVGAATAGGGGGGGRATSPLAYVPAGHLYKSVLHWVGTGGGAGRLPGIGGAPPRPGDVAVANISDS